MARPDAGPASTGDDKPWYDLAWAKVQRVSACQVAADNFLKHDRIPFRSERERRAYSDLEFEILMTSLVAKFAVSESVPQLIADSHAIVDQPIKVIGGKVSDVIGESLFPQGDKVPAALYKLALSQEKLGQAAAARRTLQDLVKRYPLSGEAQLARERLGTRR